eukprot:1492482-Pyramimonas_sp.AAC.1
MRTAGGTAGEVAEVAASRARQMAAERLVLPLPEGPHTNTSGGNGGVVVGWGRSVAPLLWELLPGCVVGVAWVITLVRIRERSGGTRGETERWWDVRPVTAVDAQRGPPMPRAWNMPNMPGGVAVHMVVSVFR